MGLQNGVRDFNGLAQKPLCYRYTIPHSIVKQFQYVACSCPQRGAPQLGRRGSRRSTRTLLRLASLLRLLSRHGRGTSRVRAPR